ncbi:MAG: sodium-dependent transporter, partial [Pseudomonadales bacterium]|nr:sodium-dependent transporter [Pseudomonadales bacterium]
GVFDGASGDQSGQIFDNFLADPASVLLWHTLFMAATILIVARGVARGLEVAVRYLMPILLIMLLGLVGYAAIYGDFARGFEFLFSFDFSKLSWGGTLTAMGHAFFTLSLGMGAIMAYGAYVPSESSISTTVVTIGVLDTVVALAAGLAIFPIVFAVAGLEPGEGPGLMFVTLPIAFGNLP